MVDPEKPRIISFLEVERSKAQRKCILCKKTGVEQMVICDGCMTFGYCSQKCLRLDRAAHLEQCQLIAMSKSRSYDPGEGCRLAAIVTLPGASGDGHRTPAGTVPAQADGSLHRQNLNRKKRNKNRRRKGKSEDTYSHELKTEFGELGNKQENTEKTKAALDTPSDFGEGWWKTKSKTSGSNPNQTKYFKVPVNKDSCRSADFPEPDRPATNVPGKKSVRQQRAEEIAGSMQGMEFKPRQCSSCDKVSTQLLTCSRCSCTYYCNRDCQIQDFQKHKEFCRRAGKFCDAHKEAVLLMERSFDQILSSFEQMPDEFESDYNTSSTILMVQIVGSCNHPFRHAAEVMDVHGNTTNVFFYTPTNTYTRYIGLGPEGLVLNIDLEFCLTPKNFMILFDPRWHLFLDGTVGIRIDDMESVFFIPTIDSLREF
ncbi:uncharacterized protein LOC131931121 [Physella acuta]|uniref:uncharacterized protein LOC131931121 n=1 Tax=Physella acuta TaxID=109671 RepID=UPI0027DBF726|nr:uncharacterized protein LOC131931121 [Physella acuta]